MKRLLIVIPIALIALAALVWSQYRKTPFFVSGFIESHQIRVGSRIGGRVAQVQAVEGQTVHKGEPLLQLEPYDLRERLVEARATLAAQQAVLDKLKAGSRKEDIDQARAARDRAQVVLAKLIAGARPLEIRVQDARLAEAQATLALLEAGSRPEDIAQADANVASAQAAVAVIEEQMTELTVSAPVDSSVEAVDLRPGDLIAPNAPVISLADPSELWVRAFMPENRLDLQLGQKVSVRVDSFPGRRYAGHISYIARTAEFTPSNVQTPEERSKQVFRIKVVLDEGRDVLRAGMSADVYLEPDK